MTGRGLAGTRAAVACLALGVADAGAVDLWLAPRALRGSVGHGAGRGTGAGPGISLGARRPTASPPPPAFGGLPPPAGEARGTSVPRSPELPLPAPVTLGFPTEGHDLGAAGRDAVAGVADLLRRRPDLAITVQGHADWRGSETHNRALSLKRAQAVAGLLGQQGIATARVATSGLGSAQALDLSDGPEALRKNRRVVIRWQRSAP